MDIKNHRVLIIGGTSGIGLAVAAGVAQRGATPIVASRRSSSVERAIAALPDGAEGHVVDVSDPDSLSAVLEATGHVDHLVYTAGEPINLVPLPDLDGATLSSFFETRFLGAVAVARAFAPIMPKEGSITFTSGTAAERPGAGWALGASICGAMNGLTRALAVELAPLRVNAIAPGVVRSPLWANLTEADREALYDGVGAALPLGRVGETEDIARAYVYMMEQDFGTGIVLTVDGGTLLA